MKYLWSSINILIWIMQGIVFHLKKLVHIGTFLHIIFVAALPLKIRLSWSWLYGSWIYNCLFSQLLSPLKLWAWIPLMARCTRYYIMWVSLSMTCHRSVVFSGYFGFLHQWNWPPRCYWNIAEIGVKLHNPNIPIPILEVLPYHLWSSVSMVVVWQTLTYSFTCEFVVPVIYAFLLP